MKLTQEQKDKINKAFDNMSLQQLIEISNYIDKIESQSRCNNHLTNNTEIYFKDKNGNVFDINGELILNK